MGLGEDPHGAGVPMVSGSPCVLLPPLQRWLGGSWCHHACHLPSVLPGGGTCPARGSTGLGPAGSSSRDARGQGQPCSAPRLSTQSQRQHRGEVLVTPPGTPRHTGSGLYWDFRHLQALLHSGRGVLQEPGCRLHPKSVPSTPLRLPWGRGSGGCCGSGVGALGCGQEKGMPTTQRGQSQAAAQPSMEPVTPLHFSILLCLCLLLLGP